jgi:hypothetical protein
MNIVNGGSNAVHYLDMNTGETFMRMSKDNWYELHGDYLEQVFCTEELEKLFLEWIK